MQGTKCNGHSHCLKNGLVRITYNFYGIPDRLDGFY